MIVPNKMSAAELVACAEALVSTTHRTVAEVSEAMVAWSRLGLSQSDINDSVRSSLMTSNIIERRFKPR